MPKNIYQVLDMVYEPDYNGSTDRKNISGLCTCIFRVRRTEMTLPDKTVRFLQKAGMDEENLRQLETLRKEDGKEEMVRSLRKFRFEVLEKIHEKQQCLDSLDYLIYKVREGTFDK